MNDHPPAPLTLGYHDRLVAFDSNALTYFLDGNRDNYSQRPDDPLSAQRIAAVRLFLHCKVTIVPTVRAEALRIANPEKLDEHIRFINANFHEYLPNDHQKRRIQRRAEELLPYHADRDDCRVLAEVEEDGDIPTLVTWDKTFTARLVSRTQIRLKSPVECWEAFAIPPGTPPQWTPAPGHPLANATWWRW